MRRRPTVTFSRWVRPWRRASTWSCSAAAYPPAASTTRAARGLASRVSQAKIPPKFSPATWGDLPEDQKITFWEGWIAALQLAALSMQGRDDRTSFIAGFARDVRSLIVTNTRLEVDGGDGDAVVHFPNTTVADLVEGLARARVNTRRMIGILQAIMAAGALHADIVVQ